MQGVLVRTELRPGIPCSQARFALARIAAAVRGNLARVFGESSESPAGLGQI